MSANNRADQSNVARFETPAQELRRLLRQANRSHLLKKGTKLFCAECQRLERVIDVFGNFEAKLACNHRRVIEAGLAQRIVKLEQLTQEAEEEEAQPVACDDGEV